MKNKSSQAVNKINLINPGVIAATAKRMKHKRGEGKSTDKNINTNKQRDKVVPSKREEGIQTLTKVQTNHCMLPILNTLLC